MFSHIMVGSNDIARSRNSTMLCLSQWALSRVSRSQVAGYFTRTMAGVSPSMASRRLLIPMAARSASQWLALHRPTHGTKPASRMAVPRSQASCLSIRRSKLRRATLFGRSSRAKGLCGARFGLCRGSDLAVLATTGVRHFASAIVYPIAQPNRATLQHLAALQLDGANRRCNAGILVARVEDARRASRSIDGGTDRKADLVDQAGP